MHVHERQLQYVIAAYGRGELDECVRWVRKLVNAAPRATAPRQLLAALYHQLGEDRLALFHYKALLPQALNRGELFRALAIQKRIDPLLPAESVAPTRWRALRMRFRPRRGVDFAAPAALGRAWVESQVLDLPDAWFERVALESRIEMFGGASARVEEVGTPTVWEVVAGRLRWSCLLPDGRVSGDVLSAEGDTIQIHPEVAERAWLSFTSDLPVECLRFDPPLARALAGVLQGGRPAGLGATGWVGLGTGARRAHWTDEPADYTNPVSMRSPTGEPGHPADAPGGAADSGDWLDFGVIELPAEPVSSEGADLGPGLATPPAAGAEPPAASIPSPRPTEPPFGLEPNSYATSHGRSAPDSTSAGWRGNPGSDPIETGEGFGLPIDIDPFAAPMAGLERPLERRRQARVAVSFETRMAVLRLRGVRSTAPIRGELVDLSATGLGVRVTNSPPIASSDALDHAVLAIELAIPGPGGPLQVAGQVRRVERNQRGRAVRIGIEFVLMTETERRRIASTLAMAALGTRTQRAA